MLEPGATFQPESEIAGLANIGNLLDAQVTCGSPGTCTRLAFAIPICAGHDILLLDDSRAG
jgi:ABC-type polysaccharide/polyol phosphate transport system ATPase subunit